MKQFRLTLVTLLLAIGSLFPLPSHADGLTLADIYAIGEWWMDEGGPSLSKALGLNNGFRAAGPTVPVFIINKTNRDLLISLEGNNCRDWHQLVIKSGKKIPWSCGGAQHYRVKFGSTRQHATGGRIYAFKDTTPRMFKPSQLVFKDITDLVMEHTENPSN